MTRNAWLPRFAGASGEALTVYCFPYAGGSAPLYRGWALADPGAPVRYQPVELPGRGSRMAEPPIDDLHRLACAFLDACRVELTQAPFALFGHSMGGMICAHLADMMVKQGLPAPVHLFVSAVAPRLGPSLAPSVALDDAALITKLRDLKGTPEAILRDRALMEVLLPALRSDFALIGSRSAEASSPVRSDLTVFSGSIDDHAPPDEVSLWSRLATRSFRHVELVGDHFFLHAQGERMRREIGLDLIRTRQAH